MDQRLHTALFEEAISKVEQWISESIPTATRLKPPELQSVSPVFRAGWKFPQLRNLPACSLLFEGTFPFSLPRVQITDRELRERCPHVEHSGVLCLFEPDQFFSASSPLHLVKAVMTSASRLIRKYQSGDIESEFDQEWPIYWTRDVKPLQRAYSLVDLKKGSRKILYTSIEGGDRYFYDDDEQLRYRIPLNSRGVAPSRFETNAAFIELKDFPKPWDFPDSGQQLERFIKKYASSTELDILDNLISERQKRLSLLFKTNGPVVHLLAGAVLRPPEQLKFEKNGRITLAGFRSGSISDDVFRFSILSGRAPLKRIQVDRLDHAWIHGRSLDPTQGVLMGKHVILIGVGSLGSGVAELLGRAGVGTLTLIDGETLESANISRHSLGARAIGQNKADRLAKVIQENLPHLTVKGIPKNFEDLQTTELDSLRQADLIICCIAEWASELALDRFQALHAAGEFPPVLYGWLEAHALAGHGVLVPTGSARFKDMLNHSGQRRFHTFDWPDGSNGVRIVCGAIHAPYGSVDLSQTQALIGRIALDTILREEDATCWRSWVGDIERARQLGGELTQEWIELHGDTPVGQYYCETPWPRPEVGGHA
ncbi:hypothetical protein GETHLI_34140 [Geothrix limicola]|uniref:THIF-type NAD/FAD binding fold domain-containing protein n=1 Tax=Geothrix limicola TaxID=2927978 RepID=A0ABQ5QJY6_9BACT|nr:ThiF family adenylyltransferase [Geothrix limicola]GLH74912.1 hypothetical protein GETHLI_34140 [Geothrix limicola]